MHIEGGSPRNHEPESDITIGSVLYDPLMACLCFIPIHLVLGCLIAAEKTVTCCERNYKKMQRDHSNSALNADTIAIQQIKRMN